jgi:hypothetical protein
MRSRDWVPISGECVQPLLQVASGGFVLTDVQIAIPSDIGYASFFDEEIERLGLVVCSYVEGDGDLFKLTPRGQKVLADRGAGLSQL